MSMTFDTPGQDPTGDLQRVRLTPWPLDHACLCNPILMRHFAMETSWSAVEIKARRGTRWSSQTTDQHLRVLGMCSISVPQLIFSRLHTQSTLPAESRTRSTRVKGTIRFHKVGEGLMVIHTQAGQTNDAINLLGYVVGC